MSNLSAAIYPIEWNEGHVQLLIGVIAIYDAVAVAETAPLTGCQSSEPRLLAFRSLQVGALAVMAWYVGMP